MESERDARLRAMRYESRHARADRKAGIGKIMPGSAEGALSRVGRLFYQPEQGPTRSGRR